VSAGTGGAVKLDAHGLMIQLPRGWSGRLFRRTGTVATLHAASYALPLRDGEFGDESTAAMPAGGVFLALTEYETGRGLEAGAGLFASKRIPLPLDPTRFGRDRLAHPRPGQLGMQHFFSTSGRPLCLYVVMSGGRGVRRARLAALNQILGSLRISAPG
jgi:hypothetical protein